MKKNFTNIIVLVSMLLHFLHIIRGPELAFTIGGRFPYVLYYGAMGLYILCFLYYTYASAKKLSTKRKSNPKN